MDFDLGASKNISNKVSDIDDLSNNDFHVHALEQEMKKIEAFKRDLPHCMHLLKDAIERLKEESGREVVEELTLIKNYGEGDGRVKASNDFTENKNWMSSAQLFTPLSRNKDSVFHHRPRPGCAGECKFRNGVGAFLPFKKSTSSVVEEKHGTAAADSLSLAVAEGEKSDYEFGKAKLEKPHQQEQQKKLRRYWSPELHKIFVEALHQLGGAQKATPKQIREVMNVDGLTNDEVKSHLQKYRIHIKRAGEQLAITGPVHEEQPTL